MKVCKSLILFLSIAAAGLAEKKGEPFKPAPIESYASKQSNQGLAIAAVAYDNADEAKPAFGKLNPYEHGVLPVLVIMKNEGQQTLSLDQVRFQYMTSDGRKIDETPAEEIAMIKGPSRPKLTQTLPGGVPGMKTGKNPLKNAVIVERAFAAKMLPPGETAHGFVYFQTGHARGASLYLTGIRDARSKQELFYFEISLGAK